MLNMYNTVHVTQTRKNLFPSNSSKHTQPHSLFQMTQNSASVNCLATYVCCSKCMFKFIISFLNGGGGIILIDIKLFVGKGYPRKQRTLIPLEQ